MNTGFRSQYLTTTLSIPTEFAQHGVAGLERLIRTVSIAADGFGLITGTTCPEESGTVPLMLNTGVESLSPVIEYGISVLSE